MGSKLKFFGWDIKSIHFLFERDGLSNESKFWASMTSMAFMASQAMIEHYGTLSIWNCDQTIESIFWGNLIKNNFNNFNYSRHNSTTGRNLINSWKINKNPSVTCRRRNSKGKINTGASTSFRFKFFLLKFPFCLKDSSNRRCATHYAVWKFWNFLKNKENFKF
jgi:hypothetical protein